MGQYAAKFLRKSEPVINIVIEGLDGAGKTTLLYKMDAGEVVTTIPSIGVNFESVQVNKNSKITALDMGGRTMSLQRIMLNHVVKEISAHVYIVDSSSDRDWLEIGRELLWQNVMRRKLELNNSGKRVDTIAILANKQDLPDALSIIELKDRLKVQELREEGDVTVEVFPISGLTGAGVWEAVDWIIDDVIKKRTAARLVKPILEIEKRVVEKQKIMDHNNNMSKSVLGNAVEYMKQLAFF